MQFSSSANKQLRMHRKAVANKPKYKMSHSYTLLHMHNTTKHTQLQEWRRVVFSRSIFYSAQILQLLHTFAYLNITTHLLLHLFFFLSAFFFSSSFLSLSSAHIYTNLRGIRLHHRRNSERKNIENLFTKHKCAHIPIASLLSHIYLHIRPLWIAQNFISGWKMEKKTASCKWW